MESIGKSVIRKEALDKVTGKAKYTGDKMEKGILHVRPVISTYGHAKISHIHMEEAMRLSGVKKIIAQKKYPLTGEEIRDRPPIAVDKVRYHGEVVALVIAHSEAIAKKAASLIKVDYEPLPVVNSPSEAVAANAPLVHEDVSQYKREEGAQPISRSNISNHVKIRKGNLNNGWASSAVTVEGSYSFNPSDHLAMETRTATCEIKENGQIIITSSSQAPFMIKKLISEYFQIAVGMVTINTPLVGGGYGGKASVQQEILAYIASKEVGGKKVKIVYSREEDLITAPCHIGLDAKIKLGATVDGYLTVAEIVYLFDSGAYSDKAVHLARAGAVDCTGPYYIENIHCDSYSVYTNHPYPSPFRGFSHSEVLFAFERTMDLLAAKLNIDPLILREKNAIAPGHTSPTLVKLNRSNVGDLFQCINKLKHLIGWKDGVTQRIDHRRIRVKGISCFWKNSTIPTDSSSGVILTFNEDGSINIISGVVEIGTGTKTVLAQMLAEKLKMDVNHIHVQMKVNTQSTPEHWKTVASRGTFMAGRALLAAADDVIKQLKEITATVLRVPEKDLSIANSRIFLRDDPSIGLHFKDIAYGYTYPNGNAIGGQIIGRGTYIQRRMTHLDQETGSGKPGPEWAVGAQAVEIEYDVKEYTYKVVQAVTVVDVGEVLNEKAARGQVIGAMSMGLAFAGRETFIFDDMARVLNPQIRTYRPLQYGEHPKYVVEYVKTPHIEAPFGARGLGEQGLLGMPAALASALSNASEIFLNELPLTPELIWRKKGGKFYDSI